MDLYPCSVDCFKGKPKSLAFTLTCREVAQAMVSRMYSWLMMEIDLVPDKWFNYKVDNTYDDLSKSPFPLLRRYLTHVHITISATRHAAVDLRDVLGYLEGFENITLLLCEFVDWWTPKLARPIVELWPPITYPDEVCTLVHDDGKCLEVRNAIYGSAQDWVTQLRKPIAPRIASPTPPVMSASTTSDPPLISRSGLLALPQEIKNLIYDLVAVAEEHVSKDEHADPIQEVVKPFAVGQEHLKSRDREWDGEGAHFLLHKSLDSVYPLLPDLLTSVEIYAWEVDGCLGKDLKIIFAYLASFRNLKLVTVAVWEFLDKEVVECLVAMWPSIRLECPIDVIYNYYTVMTRNPSLICQSKRIVVLYATLTSDSCRY
ncbi:hypothetical protein ANO11243_051100 [Dothideomycetidae sp. 11243]|nr:hypothetical protein ANO11243_051100 [fungal sp. No.11243]